MKKNKQTILFQRYLHSAVLLRTLHAHTQFITKIMQLQGIPDWFGIQRSQVVPGSCCRKGFCLFRDKHWLYQQLIIGHGKHGQKFHILGLLQDELWLDKCRVWPETVCPIQHNLWQVNTDSEQLRFWSEQLKKPQ